MAVTASKLLIEFDTNGVPQVKADINDVGQSVDKVDKKFGSAGKSSGSFFKNMLAVGGGVVGAGLFTKLTGGITGFASGLVMANASAETFRNQLNVAVGDTEQAGKIFDFMKTMAKDTPFEFPELIQGAANLEALGQSSQKWMPIIGNTAAATNKSIDQTVQAVLDAQTGEFERLKEFGIRSKVEGDKVVFSFMQNGKMMTVEAENTSEGISNALMGIWDNKYDGAMEKMSHTFMGQLSTLKDNIAIALQDMGKPLFDFAKQGMEVANSFFQNFEALSGTSFSLPKKALLALKMTMIDVFGASTGAKINKVITEIADTLADVADIAETVADVIGDALGGAFDLIADNLDIVIPLVKGFIGAFAGMVAIGAIVAVVAGALALLTSPIFLISAAIAALYLAWTTNFLGIQDITKSAIQTIQQAIALFRAAWDNDWGGIRTTIANAISFIRDHFSQIVGVIAALAGPIGMTIMTIVKHWDELKEAFQTDGILGGLKAFGAALLEEFSGVFETIGNIVNAIRNLDWGGFLAGAWDVIQTGLQMAWDAITSIDWSDFISDLAWGTYVKLLEWADWIGGKIADFGVWLAGKIGDIPWGDLITGTIEIATWLADKINPIDWTLYIGGKVEDFASWAIDKITALDLPGLVAGKIEDFGKWALTKIVQLNLPDFIAGKVEDFGTWALGKVTQLNLPGLITGTIADFGEWAITKVVRLNLPDFIKGKVEDFGAWALAKVTQLYLPDFISGMIENFAEWLKGFVTELDLAGLAANITPTFISDWIKKQIPPIPWPDMPSAGEIAQWIKDAIKGLMPGGESGTGGVGSTPGGGFGGGVGGPPGQGRGFRQFADHETGFNPFGDTDSLKNALGSALDRLKPTIDTKMAEIQTSFTTGVAGWVTAFGTGLQSLLTVTNAIFVTAIPANISAGLSTASTSVTTGLAGWTSSFATQLQAILTVTSSIFVTAIPANVQAGMDAANGTISGSLGEWVSSFASQTQAILTVVSAIFATAIPANVQTGMDDASGTISGSLGEWVGSFAEQLQSILTVTNAIFVTAIPANVQTGMDAATGTITDVSSSWPGIVASADLHGAGLRIMAGLNGGILDGWSVVRSTLQWISNQIPDWKGPPARDKVLLKPAGQMIMGGFKDSLESMFPSIRQSLTSFTDSLSGDARFGASYAGAGYGSFAPGPVGNTYTTINRGATTVNVYQQPGEDANDLAARIIAIIDDGHDARRD